MRSIRVFRSVMLFAAAAFAVTLTAAARAAEPFQINVILPLTGPASFLGQEENGALKVIEDNVNKAGGINGHQIRFAVQDDGSSPQTGVQLLNGVVAKKVAVVLGSSLVAVCNAMGPIVKENGPVEYCFSPGTHPPAGSYAFSSSISTSDLLLASARYFHNIGIHRIAIITSSDATGQDAERGIGAAFNASNGETIVDREHFNITDVSVAAQMAHVKASGAQLLIAWSTGTPAATLFRGVQEAGITIPVLTTNGNGTYAQMKAYASFLPKDLYFSVPAPQAPDQLADGPVKHKVMEFVNAFEAVGIKPDVGQALAWDPTQIVLDAYRKLGFDATATQIRDYIHRLRGYAGIDGIYDFSARPQRGLTAENVILARWEPSKTTWVAMSKPGGIPLASR